MGKPQTMQPAQALSLAILCLEFEAESAAKNARQWRQECSEAAQLLRRVRVARRPRRAKTESPGDSAHRPSAARPESPPDSA